MLFIKYDLILMKTKYYVSKKIQVMVKSSIFPQIRPSVPVFKCNVDSLKGKTYLATLILK